MKSAIFPPDRVTIFGILNVTPDSFSDGGRLFHGTAGVAVDAVVDLAAALIEDGAHVLDVGGESTRPGAKEVPVAEEIARTAPVIEALAKRFDAPISIDTRKAEVAEAGLSVGARIVNDVSGLRFEPRLAEVVAQADAYLVLGHMRGTPETMQREPHYEDVLADVIRELGESLDRARRAGVGAEQIAVDPGIGFGKRLSDNLALLANAGRLRKRLEVPVLVGPSRKSFLAALTGDPVDARDCATHAACAVAVFAGADGVRVHDVAGAARAVIVAEALRAACKETIS
ncbi:MAG: dihydropteroate synthase [Myxococcales bacterium]|nr:dihydropteroate synthase [Myxococcales bacterium]MDH5306901.1 dihydropteroate synthase [Myxococcales bacterium]MDH5566294.1 dihydropteroate synthase [Myxococcales bacterium]